MSKNDSKRNTLTAFTQDEASLAVIKDFAAKQGFSSSVIENGDIDNATAFLKSNRTPMFLLLQVGNKETIFDQLDKLADLCEPGVKLILTGKENDLKFYMSLINIGVTEYILEPFTVDDLDKAFNKGNIATKKKEEETVGKFIGVMATRGGVGATTIANLLGYTIADKFEIKTVIVDLDSQFGTVSLDFDLEPSRGYREAMEKPDRIDSLFIERLLIKHDENLSLLSSEENLELEVKYSDAALAALCTELEPKFKAIIFDIPRVVRKITTQAMQKVEYLLIVAEPTVSSLRDAARICEAASHINPAIKIKILLNRIGIGKKNEMPTTDFAKHLKRKVDFEIPYMPDLYGFSSTGKPLPLVLAKNKLVDAINVFCGELFSQAISEQKGVADKSLFKKFMKK